jgi:hypothetical protein
LVIIHYRLLRRGNTKINKLFYYTDFLYHITNNRFLQNIQIQNERQWIILKIYNYYCNNYALMSPNLCKMIKNIPSMMKNWLHRQSFSMIVSWPQASLMSQPRNRFLYFSKSLINYNVTWNLSTKVFFLGMFWRNLLFVIW